MRLLHRKSEPERLFDGVGDSLATLAGGIRSRSLMKAGLIAGGVAALTAGSAAISALRRRIGESGS
jgi:hypothetical protein